MKKGIASLILICFLFSCGSKQEQQQVQNPQPRSITQPTPDFFEPDTQTEITQERTEWQNPENVIQSLGPLEGKTVADIGAGAGYFSFKLARIAEKVIALDIDPNALEYIEEQKDIVGDWTKNIEPRLTPPDVPNLLPNEVDIVLMVNTFPFIPQPEKYFSRLLANIKAGGQLVIVDFKSGEIPVGPAEKLKTDPKEVRSILRKSGYRSIDLDLESLNYQFIIKANK